MSEIFVWNIVLHQILSNQLVQLDLSYHFWPPNPFLTLSNWIWMMTIWEIWVCCQFYQGTVNYNHFWNVPLGSLMCLLQITNWHWTLSSTIHAVNRHFIHQYLPKTQTLLKWSWLIQVVTHNCAFRYFNVSFTNHYWHSFVIIDSFCCKQMLYPPTPNVKYYSNGYNCDDG